MRFQGSPSAVIRPSRRSRIPWLAVVLGLIGLALILVVGWVGVRQRESCEAKGGFYLTREGACVRGIEEVP